MNKLPWIEKAITFIGVSEVNGSNSSPIIDGWACELSGTKTVPPYLRNAPWCGTFVAKCLRDSGMVQAKIDNAATGKQYPRHWYRAGDYRSVAKKITKPAYGCVAVKTRSGGNHVFFVVGKTKAGKIVGLGGNQSNKVCYALFEPSDLDYFWYGETNRPADTRFTLPIISNVTATKVTEA